tara:strand:+ start:2676 stop:3182 length:507 start_codon:yes stop_codon:yes gene_type:complete
MTTTLDSLISNEGFISICKQFLYENEFYYSLFKGQGRLYKDYSDFNSKVKEVSYGIFENEEGTGILVYEFWIKLKCGKTYLRDIPINNILRYFKTNSIYRLFKETLPLLDKLIKGEIHQRELAPILFDLGGVLDYTIALKQTEISIGSRLINIYREGNNLLNALKKLK